MITSIRPLTLQTFCVNSLYVKEILKDEIVKKGRKTKEKISETRARNKETKKAEKEINLTVSDQTKEEIKVLANDKAIDAAKLMKKALETNKLIQYTLFFMSNEQANKIEYARSDKEFINGVANYFDFGKIYESEEIADIYVFDPKSDKFNKDSKYLVSLSVLDVYKKDEMFIDKIRKHSQTDKKEDTNEETHSSIKFKEEEVIHPIIFEKTEVEDDVPVKNSNISDELYNKLEKEFKPFLPEDQERTYIKNTDLVYLMIPQESGMNNTYTIDTGTCMGKGKTYILANTPNDRIFVSVKDHPEIVKKIIGNVFYCLEPKEIQEVISDYFRNMNIYKYIDMNNTEFLNDISTEEFQKLGKKLTFIISIMKSNAEDEIRIPRLRFKEWNNIDKFTLVSDSDVKSPLAETGETSNVFDSDISFKVNGDEIVKYYKGTESKHVIEHYGEM